MENNTRGDALPLQWLSRVDLILVISYDLKCNANGIPVNGNDVLVSGYLISNGLDIILCYACICFNVYSMIHGFYNLLHLVILLMFGADDEPLATCFAARFEFIW